MPRFALFSLLPALVLAWLPASPSAPPAQPKQPTIAGITTVMRNNSHSELLLGRILETATLDGKGTPIPLDLVSLYVDQVPEKGDISRELAAKHHVPIYDTIAGALTRGGDRLAVDGVMIVAEHGTYDTSKTGQTIYPKRRFFEQLFAEFDHSRRVVPVFNDKHLADNWTDAKWIYDEAKKRNIPMMAGSSVPSAYRYPPTDVKRGAELKQIVGLSYGRLDAYGFHGLEMMQSLAERRAGGETGVKQVQCLTGDAVWEAEKTGVYDRKVFDAAFARLTNKRVRPGKTIRESVKEPVLFVIDYNDGLRACLFTLNGAVAEFASGWQYSDGTIDSTLFALQEDRPYIHFKFLLDGIVGMMQTGKPTRPVERTLLTSGILDAALTSKLKNDEVILTPQMNMKYETAWNWKQPPPPPPAQKRKK